MNSTYEFTLMEGPKVKMKIFLGTKSWRNFLEGLKGKVDIFIRTKNIFNALSYNVKLTKISIANCLDETTIHVDTYDTLLITLLLGKWFGTLA